MTPVDLAQRIAALDWSTCSLQHQLAVTAAILTLSQGIEPMPAPTPSNVIPLPVRPRTCWTTIHQLDGRQWAMSSHFGPNGAWAWIVESVAHEHSVSEDQIGCAESDADGIYDGDDLVTIDGLPAYRIRHLVS